MVRLLFPCVHYDPMGQGTLRVLLGQDFSLTSQIRKRQAYSNSSLCKSSAFVSAEGTEYQSVHLYPKMKELNVSFFFKYYF